RSDDGGDSWGPLRLVATEPITNGSGKAGNPIPVADGDRVALMVLETPCESGSACSCSGEQHFALYRSDDRGDSWTAREEITADVTQAGWGGVLLGPGSGFVMRGGSNPGRLVIPAKHGGSSHLLISDDHGESWSVGASGDSPLAVNESTAAVLSDGRILINARYQRSLDQQIQEQGLGFRLVGHVAGDGDWSYADDPTFFRESLFPGPVVHAALLSRSEGALFGDEARILFSYPAGEFGTSAGRRRDLRIYVSRDDGESWARTHRAIGNWAAYSDLTNLGDGRVGMLYEGGHELGPSLDAYRRVHSMRVRPEWLDHAALATYGFEELAVDATPTQLAGAGGFPLDLAVQGTLTAVAGRHDSSTALRFDGSAQACVVVDDNMLDFGQRDSFAIEASFRTSAHQSGGSAESGTLVSKTGVGTTPAWWLRIEDGHLRFLLSQCPGEQINCGLLTGACDLLSNCSNAGISGGPMVSDGAWHDVRVERDAVAEVLRLTVDGVVVGEEPAAALGVIINDEPLCLGAFSEGAPARVFDGDLEGVRIELL
ncbi:MAG: exo-alpha-sialidase, partial [Myxococcales bacterium]|nr:exo-alpha-sialidase [Myxococcales bacterium]